jgi:hypothetical protein
VIADEREPVTSVKSVFGRGWLLLFGIALGGLTGAADLAMNGSPSRAATDLVIVAG